MLIPTIESWDNRRDFIVAGNHAETIQFAVEHWIHCAQRSIQRRGRFAVALSGGSTPKAIYQSLTETKGDLEWDKVHLFWSDERGVPPEHPDSNYRMAMESGLKTLPIPPGQIFRMEAEKKPELSARDYEEKIRHHLGKNLFDFIMLGVGQDGHTASLFPNTPVLEAEKHLVQASYIPDKQSWRLTLTFPCINQSQRIGIYALGNDKADIVRAVLDAPIISDYPASRLGTPQHKALWILDAAAASKLR